MRKTLVIAILFFMMSGLSPMTNLFCGAEEMNTEFEKDIFKTSTGPLEITFIGHGTLIFAFAGKTIHVDPWSALADYTKMPKADLVLVTHHHRDHLDTAALEPICGPDTEVVMTDLCRKTLAEAGWKDCGKIRISGNGEVFAAAGMTIETVPAYNVIHRRDNGLPFHPRGEGNGYVIDFGGTRVYAAGDTEDIPEMAALKDIGAAFLPMNLPYTMNPAMAAKAARSFSPAVLYPYHLGETDAAELVGLLKDTPAIEVRLRKMK